jgi:4-amino-4-deoxy-L-arabinose transferase-like glycosyltransferase
VDLQGLLSIADTAPPSHRRQFEGAARLAGLCAVVLGICAAWFYAQSDLTLSHYDAKAHLVVARRVIDSLTPGWKQIGAVWLPLPHLLNLFPVQIDVFYRTGASAVALSVLSFGVMAYACTRLILDLTGSRSAALAGFAVLALNPDILYLQSTPMTEPLLLGLTTLSVALLSR